MVPNLEHVVQAVRDSKTWPFKTKADLCAYSHACIVALHQADPRFGKLKKAPAQNHCEDPSGKLGAVDVALYQPTGQIVDFITSAGYDFPPDTEYEDQNAVSWHVGPEGEYGSDDWFAPGSGQPVPEPPEPEPPANDYEQRIAALEQQVAQMRTDLLTKAEKSRVEAINDRVVAIDDATYKKGNMPEYVGRAPLFGGTVVSVAREDQE